MNVTYLYIGRNVKERRRGIGETAMGAGNSRGRETTDGRKKEKTGLRVGMAFLYT